MKKKILGIFVMTLLITTAIFTVIEASAVHKIKASNYELNTEFRKPITFTNYKNGDELDQNQSDYCGWGWVVWGPDFKLAQSFKPTLNMISRVELLLYLVGTPGKLEISIRSELSGPDLTSIIEDGTNISGSQEHWAEFDFPNIGIEPEQTYYIIWSTIDTDSTNYFVWAYGDYNPYDRGDAYTYSPAEGWRINEGTQNHPDIDFCFKTYGIHNDPPNKPIITVPEKVRRGKLFTVEAVTTDPDGDDVYYRDEFMGCTGPWFGPYPSGQKYSYTMVIAGSPGTYTLGVQAKDINEAESEWAYAQINVTKTKAINTPFLNFLQSHPNLFPILKKILLLQR